MELRPKRRWQDQLLLVMGDDDNDDDNDDEGQDDRIWCKKPQVEETQLH